MSLISDIGQAFGLGDNAVTDNGWISALQPASFRGVPFAVLGSEGRFGRRIAVHEYPYRDTPWVEDIGRATRRINISGFLVTDSAVYGGGDVIAQRERLIAACEQAGPGTLIHPTLGRLTVSLGQGGLGTEERWDAGRYFAISMSFIESGQKIFPSIITSTGDAVDAAADAADLSCGADYSKRATPALMGGAVVTAQAVNEAAQWARSAQRIANDATNLYHLVGTLKGTYGRYFGGRNHGGLDNAVSAVTGTASTIGTLIAQGARSRSDVFAATNALSTSAVNLGL